MGSNKEKKLKKWIKGIKNDKFAIAKLGKRYLYEYDEQYKKNTI